jgi:hypothetical protein
MGRTAQQVIDEVIATLEAATHVVSARQANVKALAAARAAWNGHRWRLKLREGASFTTNQSGMKSAAKGFALNVVVAGKQIGELRFSEAAGKSPTLRRRGSTKVLDWSNDAEDAAQLRELIEAGSGEGGGSPELQIQLQLFRLLAGPKQAGLEALRNLTPVLPFGFATEMPTSVNAEGIAATGNIDILARTGRGRASKLVVLELKEPKMGAGGVRGAFDQAIRYAAALSIEANGAHKDDYWQLVAKTSEKKVRKSDILVNAVVVLPERLRAEAHKVLHELNLKTTPPKVDGRALDVGVLMYSATNAKQKKATLWTLQGAQWLAEGWTPSPITNTSLPSERSAIRR